MNKSMGMIEKGAAPISLFSSDLPPCSSLVRCLALSCFVVSYVALCCVVLMLFIYVLSHSLFLSFSFLFFLFHSFISHSFLTSPSFFDFSLSSVNHSPFPAHTHSHRHTHTLAHSLTHAYTNNTSQPIPFSIKNINPIRFSTISHSSFLSPLHRHTRTQTRTHTYICTHKHTYQQHIQPSRPYSPPHTTDSFLFLPPFAPTPLIPAPPSTQDTYILRVIFGRGLFRPLSPAMAVFFAS
ncbi:MAG: hypothetical protein J3R72DRAFT_140312 [Linnemannia gamsii]|nr:MAG: hypothetical protein J3R72DRAFT_140312 [Linnemannia gamsii]